MLIFSSLNVYINLLYICITSQSSFVNISEMKVPLIRNFALIEYILVDALLVSTNANKIFKVLSWVCHIKFQCMAVFSQIIAKETHPLFHQKLY